jgi:O-antigen/teichoic acid export membrane protein
MNRSDIVILGILQPIEQVGYYSIAAQLAMVINLPLMIINSMTEPQIAAAYARNEKRSMQNLFAQCALWAGLLAFIGLLTLWLIGEWILSSFLSPDFEKAYSAMMILSVGAAFNVAMGPTGSFLGMAGHERATLLSLITATTMNILLNIILIPRFDIEGAAMATTISILIAEAMKAIFIYQKLGIISGPISYFVRDADHN